MLFGYSHQGDRFRPSFAGQKTTCPLCSGTLIAKCGDIYVWHWAHSTSAQCDSWKEHETEWHRNWKAKFPVEFQEVVIQKDGVKHIADILTSSGTIIEFQNSSISTSTIQERENFYEDMIWVINAESFKDHFKLRSIVTSELRVVDQNNERLINKVRKEYEIEIKAFDDKIQHLSRELALNSGYLNTHKKELLKWQSILNKPNDFMAVILQKLSKTEERMDYDYSQIIYKIDPDKRSAYFELIQGVIGKKAAIRKKEMQLQRINDLPNYNHINRVYKIAEYKLIQSSKYKNVISVDKTTLDTLFPHVISFKSEYDFKNFGNKNGYLLAIDLHDEHNEIINSIEKTKGELTDLESQRIIKETELKEEVISILLNKVAECGTKIEKVEGRFSELTNEKLEKETEKEMLLGEQQFKKEQAILEINSLTKQQRFNAMKANKGLYTFRWMHERKSWQYATNLLYFDTGEDYLLKFFDEETIRKISIKDFLQQFIS